MGSIDIFFLNLLQDDYTKYNCFIETGTYMGDTIFSVEPYFNKLYTVEFSKIHYINTKNKYMGNKIDFIYGDSAFVFENLLPHITDKCIFF